MDIVILNHSQVKKTTSELGQPLSQLPYSTNGKIPCQNCGGGDMCGVAIYLRFGEFCRSNTYCLLYGAQAKANDRRTSSSLP
ncbi:hypothetical protein TNCV_1298591 [Trichonephila clavipes]|nr:hypothetical protein TNCV_1298591 [Trichonephila clavipes]